MSSSKAHCDAVGGENRIRAVGFSPVFTPEYDGSGLHDRRRARIENSTHIILTTVAYTPAVYSEPEDHVKGLVRSTTKWCTDLQQDCAETKHRFLSHHVTQHSCSRTTQTPLSIIHRSKQGPSSQDPHNNEHQYGAGCDRRVLNRTPIRNP